MKAELNQGTGQLTITPAEGDHGFRRLGLVNPGDSIALVVQEDGSIVAKKPKPIPKPKPEKNEE